MKFIIPFLTLATAASSESNGFYSQSSARMELLKAQRTGATARQKVQSANALRNFNPSFLQDEPECDYATEETCYDGNGTITGCELYTTGGCPCPEGQEKCNFSLEKGHSGYCIEPENCCTEEEELCLDSDFNLNGCMAKSEGGCVCPEGQTKCGSYSLLGVGYCTEFCCTDEEETCYDEDWKEIGCEPISTGGCDCPAGEVKCGTTDWSAGYCTTLCCADDEETCYDDEANPTECKPYSEGCPCPGDQVKCNAIPEWNYPGSCYDVCCTDEQEMCLDFETGSQTCADIASGGCPCPDGEIKCAAIPEVNYAGYCTPQDLCCADDEELCYTDDWNPQPKDCKSIAAGGCDCPEGEEKCGAMPEINVPGFCTTLCCEEVTCYDWTTMTPTSCVGWSEECPSGFVSFEEMKKNAVSLMDRSEMTKQAHKLQKIKAKKAKMLAMENAHHKDVEKVIEAEEVAILRMVKRRGDRIKSFGQDVPAFMAAVY